MPIELATIKGITVVQDDDQRVHWKSGAAIDADGSNGQNGHPFAYRRDDHGLDKLGNAGYPHGGWRSVLLDRGDGTPLDDGAGNFYSQTTYAWTGRPIARRFVDATTVPYVVVNPLVRRHAAGIVIGCRARVTHDGKSVKAVVADVSGVGDIGELSIAAARSLGINSDPRSGGTAHEVEFELWPGTAAVINGDTYELQRA